MADSPLIIKSKEFALQIINVCNYVKQTKKESVLTNQIIRSGTSIGANIREAFYWHGTADFIAKLEIALKEANETGKWLEMLLKTEYIDEATYKSIDKTCATIRILLIASIKTAKSRINK